MKVIASSLCLDRYDDDSVLFSASCLPLPSQKEFFGKEYKVAESPWANQEAIDKSICEISDYYETALIDISKALNHIHDVDRDVDYWRILIGPAVYWLMTSVYEKYKRFKKIEELGPSLVISSDVVRNALYQTTMDLIVKINKCPAYNLYLTNFVGRLLGLQIDFDRSVFAVEKEKIELTRNVDQSIKVKIFSYVAKKLSIFADVLLYESSLSQRFMSNLLLKSWGNICPLDKMDDIITVAKINLEARNQFLTHLGNSDIEFIRVFYKVLAHELPIVFIEGYHDLKTDCLNRLKLFRPKKICSAIGWYFNETFKCFAAEAAWEGVSLIGIQHGGNYGSSSYLFVEKHELKITQSYATWGWDIPGDKGIISLPASKLIGRENSLVSEHASDVLYISTSGTRFINQIWDLPENYVRWLDGVEKLYALLRKSTNNKLVFRPHIENLLELTERLQMKFDDMCVDSWDQPLWTSINDAKLVVSDNMNTTYIEVLFSNKPILLMWTEVMFPIRSDAKEYYADLERVGILHRSPESLVEFYKSIKNEIDKWWKSIEVQEVVSRFCQRFARQSSSSDQEWMDFLLKNK